MKKGTPLIFLLTACTLLSGCIKTDDAQPVTDVYWFPLARQTFYVDTIQKQPVDTSILVFRSRDFIYDSDTVDFAIIPDSTTAVSPAEYEILTPVVRFGKDDYYDNLLRGEIKLKLFPKSILGKKKLGLKLVYTHPNNPEKYRRHDRTVLTFEPLPLPTTPEQNGNDD